MGNTLDKITPHLWLGDHESITEKASPHVKVIVTVITKEELERYQIAEIMQERQQKGVEWHWICADDNKKEPLETHFQKVHAILEEAEKANKVAMVHCAAGISRSSTMVIAHIMLKNNWAYKQAYDHVQKCRPIITPNDGFINALKALERQMQMGEPL